MLKIFSSKVDIATLPIDSHKRKFTIEAKNFDEAIKIIESQVQSVELIPKSIKGITNLFQTGRKFKENEIISMNSEYYNQ